jgi:hypothetical protein
MPSHRAMAGQAEQSCYCTITVIVVLWTMPLEAVPVTTTLYVPFAASTGGGAVGVVTVGLGGRA